MEIVNIIVSGFLIVLGFLVKAYPNLIAGYNSLPKSYKQKIDVKGLSSLIRNTFIIMGIVIIAENYFLRYWGYPQLADASAFTVIPFVVFLVWRAKKYIIIIKT